MLEFDKLNKNIIELKLRYNKKKRVLKRLKKNKKENKKKRKNKKLKLNNYFCSYSIANFVIN